MKPKKVLRRKQQSSPIKSTYNPITKDFMAEAKTISLTIGERVAALKLFDAFKGSISTLSTLMDDVKQFPVTTEEWEKANLVKTPNGDGTEQWKWDDANRQMVNLEKADKWVEQSTSRGSRRGRRPSSSTCVA